MKRFRFTSLVLIGLLFVSQIFAQVSTFPYSEGFESDFGEWQQYTGDDFDWTRNENGTPTFLTGPGSAYEGTWYAFAETDGNQDNNTGLYAVFNFNSAGLVEPKFEFYYHMYNGFTLFGDNMGALNVLVSTNAGSTWTNLWNITGDQGNLWHKVILDLTAYSTFDNVYIGFLAEIGGGFLDQRSDIAIDNINVYEPVFNCVSIPYSQDFNASGTWPTGWSTDNTTTWSISTSWEGSAPPTGNHVYGTIAGASSGNVYSQCFDASSNTNIHVRFYHYWQATTGLFAFQDGIFYGSPDGGVTSFVIDQWDVGTASDEGWKEYDISSWADGGTRLLFWWEVSGGYVLFGTDGYWNVDDFGVQEGPWSYLYTWTGAVSSDWNNSNNWDSGFTPDHNIDVIIPGGCPNYPVLIDSLVVNYPSGAYRCESLSIENGGEVEVYHANDMVVYGDVTVEAGGTLYVGDDLRVLFGGNLYILGGAVTNNFASPGQGDMYFGNGSGGYMNSGSLTIFNYVRFFDGSTWHANGGTVNFGGTLDSALIIIQNTNVYFQDMVVENGVSAILWNTSWYPLNVNGDLTLETNAHFRIESGEIVNVAGDAFLTADATGMASLLDNGVFNVTGTTTVQQYLTSEMWHLISPPISDAEIGIYMDIYLKEYNEPTDTWTYLVNPVTLPMNPTQGYSAWASDDYTGNTTVNFAGALNANVDYPIGGLSYTPSSPAVGWNLIGNPYPSPLQWNNLWTKTDVSEWACIHTNGNDECYNALTGTGWPLAGSMADGIIPSTQGFWVRATGASATLTIPQSERIYSSQSFYKGSRVEINETIRLHVKGNNDHDALLLQFTPEATSGYDPLFDLEKRWGYLESPQIYAINGEEKFSVSVLPKLHSELIIPIGFEVGTEGLFDLSVPQLKNLNKDIVIVLEDLKENTHNILSMEDTYQFSASATDEKHRFNLYFKSGKTTDINNISETKINIFSNENIVYVQSQGNDRCDVFVYDMMGREITRKLNSREAVIHIEVNNGTGYYVVKAQTGEEFITEKVFIK